MIELFDFLKGKGFSVFFNGQKKGLCSEKYIVIRDAGIVPLSSNKAGMQLIDIIGYVNESKYTEIEEFKKNIKEMMKEFAARPTGEESPIIPEDSIKAYSFSITYQIQKLL